MKKPDLDDVMVKEQLPTSLDDLWIVQRLMFDGTPADFLAAENTENGVEYDFGATLDAAAIFTAVTLAITGANNLTRRGYHVPPYRLVRVTASVDL